MATYIKVLKDNNTGDIIYPRTSGNAVTVTGGTTLDAKLTDVDADIVALQEQMGNPNAMTLDGHAVGYFATTALLNSAMTDIDTLEQNVSTLDTNLINTNTDISNIGSDLNNLETTVTDMGTTVTNMGTTVTNMGLVRNATITTTWTGSSAPYTQIVNVTGITATMTPIIDIVLSTTLATALLQETAWACVSKAITGAGTITFTCNKTKPVTAIPIQIKGV